MTCPVASSTARWCPATLDLALRRWDPRVPQKQAGMPRTGHVVKQPICFFISKTIEPTVLITILVVLPATQVFCEAGAQTVLCPQEAPVDNSFNSVYWQQRGH